MSDPREAEERLREAASLAEGRCPHSGLILHRAGEAGPDSASCDMCDCFGFDPELVKVHPRPLHVVRWKVIRRTCMTCKRGFGDNTGSGICHECFMESLGLDKQCPF